jgi:molecular chaperone GrpE
LFTLVSHFTALRHDVNLQTKATRAQAEQTTAALEQIQTAVGALEPPPPPDHDTPTKGLITALVEANDALHLASRELQRVFGLIPETTDYAAPPAPTLTELPTPEPPPLSFWTRWLGLDPFLNRQYEQLQTLHAERTPVAPLPVDDPLPKLRQLFAATLNGVQMSQQRIERALQHQGLHAIPTADTAFDPETMEVLEAAPAPPGVPPGLVEIRRGYRWQGRLFRTALVKVLRAVTSLDPL